MNKIKVSIIIPAWHEESIIKDALQALNNLNFNLKKCEIIVIASSDDNTFRIAKKQAMNKFGRYLILKQKPGGKNTALQQGVKAAKGEIMVLSDADVIVDCNWLTELIKPIEKKKFVCANGNVFPLLKSWITPYFMIEKTWERQIKKSPSTKGNSGIAVKKEITNKIGINVLFNKKIYTGIDHYFGDQILNNGYDICFAEKAKIFSYYNLTIKGFIKDRLRWKKAYARLITKKRTFAILAFNLAVILSLLLFILAFVFSSALLPAPFIIYFCYLFIQCILVSRVNSNISFLFYFPIYAFLDLVDRSLTCKVFLGKVLGLKYEKEKKKKHFKGERK